ncbi:hypothetical protein ABW21_db0204107 [Orbilia brochopaga]|nr:hypothetical protein ABW21_db0204107 [Drechslerella brochopaga]
MSDAPSFLQGTSSMLRVKAGGQHAANVANAALILKECAIISRAVYSQNTQGYLYNALDIKPLGAPYCPQYRLPAGDPDAGKPGCRIRVLNCDTFQCADDMLTRHNFEQSQMLIARQQGNNEPLMHPPDNGVICLNMANAFNRGGGFISGSTAQEEALMHRSTLWHTLPQHYYPMTETEAIYSPYVAIYKTAQRHDGVDQYSDYIHDHDRAITELKIRQMLRIAGLNGHRRLVLGAFGCGVFKNPKAMVAGMFLKILKEPEFQGGWWKEIVFGCFDPPGSKYPNFKIFHSVLDGHVV